MSAVGEGGLARLPGVNSHRSSARRTPSRPASSACACAAVFVLPALLAGCSHSVASSGAGTTSPSPVASPTSIPSDATTLPAMGFRNGPSTLLLPWLPVLDDSVDQPNVVMFTLPVGEGQHMVRWIRTRLGDGWVVQATSTASPRPGGAAGYSAIFHSAPGASQSWEGSFTCSTVECALSLRRQ